MLLLVGFGRLVVASTVVSNTTQIKEGIFRYHYDSNVSRCSVVTLIGVGTTMKVEDYDLLAIEIAKAKPGVIAGIIDHAPGNPIKISAKKFSKLADALTSRIHELVPICKDRDTSSGSNHHNQQPKFVVGGHSASGGAAMRSLLSLNVSPLGFIGLSPFRITGDMVHINIPSLFWGFSKATCGVDVEYAADQAYDLSSPENGRVLYQLHNPSGKPSHCIFGDNGCLPICPSSNSEEYEWIRPAVGDSVGRFLHAIEMKTFTEAAFKLSLPEKVTSQDLKMFVNGDNVTTGVDPLQMFEVLS